MFAWPRGALRRRLGEILGASHIAPGLTYVPSNIVAPGVIEHKGASSAFTFGELDGTKSRRLISFRDECLGAGLDARLVEDIEVALWTKFVAWSATSGVTAISRQPFGALQRVPELRALFVDIMKETAAIARAKGVALPEDVVETLLDALDAVPPEAKTSTLVDLENGKRLELEAGAGSVIRQAEALGIDTPICRTVYAALKPHIDGRPPVA